MQQVHFLPSKHSEEYRLKCFYHPGFFFPSSSSSCHKQCVFPGVEKISYINVAARSELRNLGKILYKVICKWLSKRESRYARMEAA